MQDVQGSRVITESEAASDQHPLIEIMQNYIEVSEDIKILSEE